MSTLVDWIRWLMGLAQPENLRTLVNLAGPWWVSYLILFAIIFSETGLLVGFFLPGDSLLFAAGLLSSQEVFNVGLLIVVQILRGRFAPATAGGWRSLLLIVLVVIVLGVAQQLPVIGTSLSVLLVLAGLGALMALVTGRASGGS